jgi:hypothetical protein
MKLSCACSLLVTFISASAFAKLPMGLKCEPQVKIVGAEVGEIGKYQVQKGMTKEEHTALVNRKKAAPVDGCHFSDIKPGQVVVARYSGPEVFDTEVQCIDQNNKDAPVTFPKSIFTVRNSNIETWKLMPLCPDGVAKDGFPCSKLASQSERGSEYKDVVLKWKAKDAKSKLYKVDLTFDRPYKNSVPANAKLFCALVNKAGNVVIAGTALYSEPAGATAAEGAAAPLTEKPAD